MDIDKDWDCSVPRYYTVRPKLVDSELEFILHALTFTPIAAVIITDAHDGDQANRFSNHIIQTTTVEAAHALAKQLSADRAVLIVTGDQTFVGINEDGSSCPIQVRN